MAEIYKSQTMEFTFDNNKYEIIVASDVDRDGLGIELWDRKKQELLVEIFRHDDLKRIEFSCFKGTIQLMLIEKLISEFETRVGRDFQNQY